MNIKIVGRTIGRVILMEMLFMLPSLIWCLIDQDYDVIGAFGKTFAIMLITAGMLLLIGRGARERSLRRRASSLSHSAGLPFR